MDQDTCMGDGEESDSDDGGGTNDISGYAKAVDIPSDDSDTLPSAKRQKISPCSAEGAQNSSSTTPESAANQPRPKGIKSPSKKAPKTKSRLSDATEIISATMEALRKSLAEPPPPPPVPKVDNPYVNLWKRLEAMALPTKDKIDVGVYLARPECEGMPIFSMVLLIQLWRLRYTNSYVPEMTSEGLELLLWYFGPSFAAARGCVHGDWFILDT